MVRLAAGPELDRWSAMKAEMSRSGEDERLDGPRRPGLVLALLCSAQLMLILDVAVVNIALPSMQRDLGFSVGGLQWVISGYTLTFGGLLILGGRCGDAFGRVRLFQLGLAVFTISSLLGGLALAPWMLVGGRLLQGTGAALVAPNALALLATSFAEGPARNRALGVWGAASAAGGAVGILIGGPLTELTWRAVLLINVPIGVVAILAASRVLQESRQAAPPRLDVRGAALITLAVGALVYGLSSAATGGFADPDVLAALALSVVLTLVFLFVESRTPDPLVPLRTFRMRNLVAGNAVALLLFGVSVGTVYFLTLYLQDVLGYSALRTGLAFLPNAVVVGVVATLAGRMMGHIGVRPMLIASLATLAVGEALFIRIDTDSGYVGVVLGPILLNAIGLGGAFVSASVAATTGVNQQEQGLATSLFITAQQIGGAIGLAVLVATATRFISEVGDTHDTVIGFRWGFAGATAFAVAAIVVAATVFQPTGGSERGADSST
jgi:EmrB/QacA subfamily drug resistance transporter